MFHDAVVARQPLRPCHSRRLRAPVPPGRRGAGRRTAERTGRRVGIAQPGPDRPGEAGVVHGAVPAVAVQVASRRRGCARRSRRRRPRSASAVRRTARATSWLMSRVPRRPVMLATSTRQPSRSNGGRSHRATTESGPSTISARRAGSAWLSFGQRAVTHPALVGAVGQEVVERPGRRARHVAGRDEPLVGVAGVVGRQVAEDPPAALVDGGREPDVGLVAAEQRVDPLEGGGVVAVVALAREDRRRVDDADPDVGEVVEVVGDPVEVAAEVLQRRAGVEALEDDLVVPVRRHRPLRGSPARRPRPSGRSGPGTPGRPPRRAPSPAAGCAS